MTGPLLIGHVIKGDHTRMQIRAIYGAPNPVGPAS